MVAIGVHIGCKKGTTMRLLSFFKYRRLQWKLTLYYVIITFVVLFVLEIIALLLFVSFVTYNKGRTLELQTGIQAQVLSDNFNGPFMNKTNLDKALKDWSIEIGVEFEGFSMIMDRNGEMIALNGEGIEKIDIPSDLPDKVQSNVDAALALTPDEAHEMKTYRHEQDGIVYIVVPLANEKDVRGTLLVKAENIQFSPEHFWKGTSAFFGWSTLIFLIGAAFVGIAFGVFTSRSLVKRIRNILVSTDQWSKGDFTILVEDRSKDELGQLARRLNQMAHKIRRLFRVQQDFATLEERNRLARELHDSVKQQLFATSIWINTGKSLIEKDVNTANEHLQKAEKLLHQTRSELSALILELRPVVLEGKDLSRALMDYIAMWQEQTGIDVKLKLTGEKQILPVVEEAYFRIIQEALNNVARHSGASLVDIHLDCEEEVTLIIQDNGGGFDMYQNKQQGVGLSSMSERTQTLKGQISIQSSPGNGVKITIQCNQANILSDGLQHDFGGRNLKNDKHADFDFNR